MKFEIYKAKDGWRFRLRARNGEIIASSEAYARKIDCRSTVEAIIDALGKSDITVIYLKS